MAFVIGRVVKVVGSGIGLGREAYLYHKEKKASSSKMSVQENDEDVYMQVSDEQAKAMVSRGEAVDVTDEKMVQEKIRNLDEEDQFSLQSEDDEQDWALDEAASPPQYQETEEPELQRTVSVGTLVREVVPKDGTPFTTAKLPYPVILPQRRPGTKGRGFVRAYAPDLAAHGIDQDTFLRFLKNFHEASHASPVFAAIFISAGIVGFVPGPITTAVGIAVQFAAGTAIELQSRLRTNTFLDDMNKEMFMPRGLYAMLVKYTPAKPGSDDETEVGVENIDLMTLKSIARYSPNDECPDSAFRTKLKNIRLVSGESKGEAAMPTICAPLIFPDLDNKLSKGNSNTLSPTSSPSSSSSLPTSPLPQSDPLSTTTSSSSTSPPAPAPSRPGLKQKFKSTQKFIADYNDRRAQASYMASNPSSTLSAQTVAPTFRSRYADPNHAASNGHLVNFVTGGKVNLPSISQRKELRKKELEEENRRRKELGLRARREKKGPIGMVVGGVKKVLKPDVLYLIVVNMPSEAELREAREVVAAAAAAAAAARAGKA